MKSVFLLTSGDGSDGDEWSLIGVYSTRELAEKAQAKFSEPIKRADGSTYIMDSEIEKWVLDGETK